MQRNSSANSPSLGIEIDATGMAMYVRVTSHGVSDTRKVGPGLLADYDSRGALVGVEIIGLKKRRVGAALASIRRRFSREAPSLEHLSLIA